jgi:tetratricopeptide (TPR) repeat protein
VVGDQNKVECLFAVEQKKDEPYIVQRQYYLQNQKKLHDEGHAVFGKVIARREKSDLALVELEKVPDGVRAIPLARELPQPADPVLSVGHRHDSEALWVLTTGTLRQKGLLTEGYYWRGKRLAENAPCWIVQSPINNGDSGSALVNRQGEVIGVLSGVRWQAPSASIAIELGEVAALLAEARKQPPPKEPLFPPPKDSIYAKLVQATGWVRPTATDSHPAGWIIDRKSKLLLTTSQGAGAFDLVDVIFPAHENNAVAADAVAYRDLIGLRQSGTLVRGVVLARDTQRDLALIELEKLPDDAGELRFADKEPLPGETIQTVNHPLGVELLWLYSTGIVRQSAKVEIINTGGEKLEQYRALLLQIPTQAGSAGSAVVNSRGEVVGLLTRKEGPQQQLGYALTAMELRSFIESARALSRPTNTEQYLKRSRYLRSRGRSALAQEMWDQWNKANPNHADLEMLFEQMQVAIDRGDFPVALKQVETYEANASPQSQRLQVAKAEILAALRRTDDVLKICNTVLQADPKCAGAYYIRALCRNGDKAIADLDEATWNDPKLVKAYFRLGQLHEEGGNDDKALTAYGQAIELDPYRAEPIRRRAALYLRKQEPKRAIADYERLIELLPTDADAYRLLATAYLAKGEEVKALVPLRSGLRWDEKIIQPILKDVHRHAEALRKQWPDDPAKAGKWLANALGLCRSIVHDAAMRQYLDEILKERDVESQVKRLGQMIGKPGK